MSTWASRYIQATPAVEDLVVPRTAVAGEVCPACGGSEIERYPVASVYGARMTVTCQGCLEVIRRERPSAEDNWPPFRAATFDWDASPSERAARIELERSGS
jgi:hypothetical protein